MELKTHFTMHLVNRKNKNRTITITQNGIGKNGIYPTLSCQEYAM